ncbi:MAG: ribosome biogenesis GTPase YqeH, partial [Cetobacterium sp.]
MTKKCIGCGIELQGENSNSNGFLPKSVLQGGSKELLCQRCFKIKNYGQYIPIKMTKDDYRNEVRKNLVEADVAIPVFDIIDFEGSFDDEILDILREMESIIV